MTSAAHSCTPSWQARLRPCVAGASRHSARALSLRRAEREIEADARNRIRAVDRALYDAREIDDSIHERFRRGIRGRVILAVAIVFLAVVPGAGRAEEYAQENRRLFLRYCAACHGEDGKGGGVVASTLLKPPPDLTRLSRDNGGDFPIGRVIRAIDGRNVFRAHGRADMPVWGEVFADDTFVGDRFGVRIRVRRLAEHVRSIQDPGG